jgi:hypothetical protein
MDHTDPDPQHWLHLTFSSIFLYIFKVPTIEGSGSRRSKNIQIRIRNTGWHTLHFLPFFYIFLRSERGKAGRGRFSTGSRQTGARQTASQQTTAEVHEQGSEPDGEWDYKGSKSWDLGCL